MQLKHLFSATALSATFFLAPSISEAQVQGGTHQKLFDLYVMGDYEKCVMKAEALTEKDNYKRESEPYLYMAMCLIEIADDPDLRDLEPFEKATKDALKSGAKFVKKDIKLKEKGEPYLYDDNYDFIQKLKFIGIQEAKAELAQNDYRKAVYYYKLALQLDENDPSVRMIKGTCDILSRNTKEGNLEVEKALEEYNALAKSSGFEPTQYNEMAFEDGFIYYTNYLIEKNQIGKAQEVMELARTLAPKNEKFIRKLKEITG